MSAYMIIRMKNDDNSFLEEHQKIASTIIQRHNGKLVEEGKGEIVLLKNPEETNQVIIYEFPTLSDAKGLYFDDEYIESTQNRKNILSAEIVSLDGVS